MDSFEKARCSMNILVLELMVALNLILTIIIFGGLLEWW